MPSMFAMVVMADIRLQARMFAVTGLPPHAFHGKHASLQAYVSHHC